MSYRMNGTLARQLALACVSGLLYPLCFPDFDLGWLAWIVLLPLHLAVRGTVLRRAFWLGWLTGLLAFVGVMFWVVTAMHLYGKVPLVISYAIMVLLASYLGLYVALYAAGCAWLRRAGSMYASLGAPFLWVTLEWLRTYLFSGLPWDLLGYSQYAWLPVIQVADLAGVYGVSFLVVLVNVALAEMGLWVLTRFRQPSQEKTVAPFPWLTPAAAALALALTLWYGQVRLKENPSTPALATPSITIGLVQANIDQAHKWDEAYRRDTLDRYQRLTEQTASGADLLIWPEAATPFLFERELDYRHEVMRLVETHRVPLLFGSPVLRYYQTGRPYLLNSAYLLAPDGNLLGRYDKQHLVPFGEYIPLKSSLLFFLDKLVEGIGDFEAGIAATVLAVENRRAFARAANTGISGFIDPQGRILLSTPIFEERAVAGAIPIERRVTFYTSYGDAFGYACVIITGLSLLAAYLRKRTEEPEQDLAPKGKR